jgi:hypothetical protein
LDNIFFGGVPLVVDFRSIDNGEDVSCVDELLLGKVLEWFDEGTRSLEKNRQVACVTAKEFSAWAGTTTPVEVVGDWWRQDCTNFW